MIKQPAEQSTQTVDVAIVGCGPAGVVLAALLGQRGRSVHVCDRLTGVHEIPRALSLDHEVLRVFQQIGVIDQVQQHIEPFTPSEFFGVDGQLIRRMTMVAPPYPQGHTPSVVFTQPPVERLLRESLAALPKVTLALGLEMRSFDQDADGVTLRYADGSTVRARYAVACDGGGSGMRGALGIELEDLGFDEPWLVVDVLVNENGLAKLPRTSVQYCEPERPCSLIIGPRNHRRWEISLQPGEDPQQAATPERTWQLLARWLTPEDGTLWRQSSYRFHALVARTWRAGRVFVAGDAAHMQPPFLGQGMCQGVRDAANLAWKLDAVLTAEVSGSAAERLLDSYGDERKAHVRELTSRIKGVGALICERDVAKARARDARLLADCGGIVKDTPRQDILPALSTGSAVRQPGRRHAVPAAAPGRRHADGRPLRPRLAAGARRHGASAPGVGRRCPRHRDRHRHRPPCRERSRGRHLDAPPRMPRRTAATRPLRVRHRGRRTCAEGPAGAAAAPVDLNTHPPEHRRHTMQRRDLNRLLAGIAMAPLALRLRAQTWPDKPVKWVLSQPPGSGPDNVARILADRLSKTWGQAVVIENKPGGQNTIGAQAAARSPADGFNFYFATTAALVTNPLLFKTLPYDPAKDFVPVAFIARSPFAVLVRTESPIASFDDLVARSKAAPGSLSLGNEGPRTFSGMIARLLNARTQAGANLVPYANVGVGTQNLMGGHVDAMVADLASTAALARQGKLRVLATTAAQRVAGWDNVPALSEKIPGFDMVGWFAVVAPTGTPAAAIARANRDINALLSEKEVAERIAVIGPLVDGSMGTDAVAAFLRAESARWQEAVREIGLLPE